MSGDNERFEPVHRKISRIGNSHVLFIPKWLKTQNPIAVSLKQNSLFVAYNQGTDNIRQVSGGAVLFIKKPAVTALGAAFGTLVRISPSTTGLTIEVAADDAVRTPNRKKLEDVRQRQGSGKRAAECISCEEEFMTNNSCFVICEPCDAFNNKMIAKLASILLGTEHDSTGVFLTRLLMR